MLDDHVKSDVGILSDDLFADLFPQLRREESSEEQADVPSILHVAIAPWAPVHSPESSSWTIVPVTKSSALAHSTVQFSPSSLALQSFAANLKRVAPSKLSIHSRSGIEILVLDASAMPLDTVFVSLEGELARRLEAGEGTFFREHPSANWTNGVSGTPEERLQDALRTALGTLKVVHSGDLFPLPLPPHPVTHVPPNPGKVALCEPVSQGILSAKTKIIVTKGRIHSKHARNEVPIPTKHLSALAEDDDGEETSNDQFYSAAEERYKTDAPTDDGGDTVTETEEEEGMTEMDVDDLSDDSMDDMISLQVPELSSTSASNMGTLGPGTPMTLGRGRKTNGISTPMSVFSNYTATTARPDRPRGRLFKAQGLLGPVPEELLHPKPASDDDDEARVYVDTKDLTRVGCFSGDWVRMEAADEPPLNGFGSFGLGSFGNHEVEEANWRPVRIFALPEGYSQRPVSRIPSSRHDGNRRPSFFESQMPKPSSPAACISPVLLANLENTPYLRLSPLKRTGPLRGPAAKLAPPFQPPPAREVTLQQVRTPVTADREVQTAVMAGLKLYFENKLRVVRAGDLIAVPIDTQLGRTLQERTGGGDSAIDDLLSLTSTKKSKATHCDEVAWFKITHVQAIRPETEDPGDEDTWASVASVDPSIARIEQTGSVTSRVPGTADSNWPYYLGLKKPPRQTSAVTPPMTLERSQKFASPLRRRLRELMAAATSKQAIHFKMPALAILLVSTQRQIGKAKTAVDACADIGLHTFAIDSYDILNEGGAGGSDVKTEGFLRSRVERALSCGPACCSLLVRHIEALTADRMVSAIKEILADARVFIATTTEVDKIPDGVRGLFTHEIEMNAPDEGEREGILRTIVEDRNIPLDPEVDLSSIALKTAALVAGDLVDVVERAIVAQQSRLEALSAKASTPEHPVSVRDIQLAGGPQATALTRPDFDAAVEAARKNFADAIGAPKIPNVTWDDVGGLNNVKDAVQETIQLPLERPELFAKGMKKRSGILFYGPPGTGKTLLAKAIATEYSLNFFSVKGPELLNMYIGESEANVRRVFQRARDARPCVVFFDELDSVAPKRGNQGDSGGVMDRIVSQLLAELDGMSGGDDGGGGVFVIGATNRPDLLDQALLRPGRFDKMLYLGVSDTHEKQLRIMEALTRKFALHASTSLARVSQTLPLTYTGADFYALCSDAMLKAVTRQANAVDAKVRELNSRRDIKHPVSTAYFFDHYATPEDVAVTVTEQDFLDARDELVPSVSAGELEHYEKVRATFEGGRGEEKKKEIGEARPRSSGKGKGKAIAIVGGKGKGKGKEVDVGGSEEDEVSDGVVNGGRNKGKGKAVFRDTTGSDDQGLYD